MILAGCRVLELGGAPAGAYAGRLFAGLGAEVVMLEPTGGGPLRRAAAAGELEDRALFRYLAAGKRSLQLELSTAEGRRELERLAAVTDVLIESASPGPFAPLSAALDQPRLVRAWISPFGRSGPYRDWRSSELTDEALGGHLFLNGERDRAPLQRPGHHAAYQAGAQAFIGAVAALCARERSGRGQLVEVSHLEGLASLHQYTTMMWIHTHHKLAREGNRQTGHYHPVGSYRCRDGWVCLAMPVAVMLLPFLVEAGLDALAADPVFADDVARGQAKDAFDAAIAPWLAERTVAEVVAIGLRARAPVGPVLSTVELLEDAHLEARRFLVPVEADGEIVRFPRGPFRFEGHEPVLGPPPALDEAGAGRLVWEPVGTAGVGRERGETSPLPAAGPLAGVRVLDLTRVWAGPLATRILGDLGADVIKVEAAWARGAAEVPAAAGPATHLYPNDEVGERPWNRELSFAKLNRNKRGLTLELDTARGREIFLRLAAGADVVIDNYSPRVMAKLGLDAAALQRLNPTLICVGMPGFGSSGPYRDWLAFGPLIEAMSGLTHDMRYPDSGPYRSGVAWPDPVTALHAAAAVVSALLARRRAPGSPGAVIEVPMQEALLSFYGEELLAVQARGEPAPTRGNRDRRHAPQGVYRARGEDRWIAISVQSDQEWAALCEEAALGAALAAAGVAQRRRRHDEIDRALEGWTSGIDAEELMRRLQRRGVVAAVVADPERLVADPQLAHAGFWVELDHAEAGPTRQPGLAIRLSATPATFRRAAPCLGQHNQEILGGELGIDPAEIAVLRAEGVIAERPPPDAAFRRLTKPGGPTVSALGEPERGS